MQIYFLTLFRGTLTASATVVFTMNAAQYNRAIVKTQTYTNSSSLPAVVTAVYTSVIQGSLSVNYPLRPGQTRIISNQVTLDGDGDTIALSCNPGGLVQCSIDGGYEK